MEHGKCEKTMSKRTSTTSSEISSYLWDSDDKFPSFTSEWNIGCLELLGIYYNEKYHDSPDDILNMIFEDTGSVQPLTEEQMIITSDVKNSITFSFPVNEITDMLIDKEKLVLKNGETFFPEIEEDIVKCQSVYTREFLLSCQLMLSCRSAFFYDLQDNIEPGDMFVSILEKFLRLCQLLPIPGSAKKTTMTLQNDFILSEPDLVMIPERYRLSFFSSPHSHHSTAYIVSTAEIKKSKSKQEVEMASKYKQSLAETGEKDCNKPPQIYSKVHTDVLAKHGGELLIHRHLYDNTISSNTAHIYLPGIIAVGSEVIFTLMKIQRQHIQQLKKQEDPTFTATIYYSKPKDLLRKEDRDQLVEAFTRLTNI